nr:hypothetical protein BaRGS_031113 [Batillaria attramentaria]
MTDCHVEWRESARRLEHLRLPDGKRQLEQSTSGSILITTVHSVSEYHGNERFAYDSDVGGLIILNVR